MGAGGPRRVIGWPTSRRRQHRPQLVACLELQCMLLLFLLQYPAASAFRVVAAASTSGRRWPGTPFRASPTQVRLQTGQRINGDDGASNSQGQRKTPQTGWRHNLPSENSSFWGTSGGDGPAAPTDAPAVAAAPRLRTGWLHNAAPAHQQAPPRTASTAAAASSSSSLATSPARRRLELAMVQQARDHRLHGVSFPAANGGKSLVVTEHSLRVPLNYTTAATAGPGADGRRIRVYFSIVEVMAEPDRHWWRALAPPSAGSPAERAQEYLRRFPAATADDMLLYLQGGPGFGAPVPVATLGLGEASSWAGAALAAGPFRRVVLMDQRGTGRSSPVTKQTLERMFPDLFRLDHLEAGARLETAPDSEGKRAVADAVDDVADYLGHFRADNIVLDAEEIREALLAPSNSTAGTAAPRPWGASLGQSFGGFCSMTYLSTVEHPPRYMLLTGGIAPQLTPCLDVYKSLWERVRDRSLLYYEMYPEDVALVKKIVRKLLQEPARLPSGGTLTARRFLQLGLALGGSPSAFASLHQLFSTAFLQIGDDELDFSRSFLKQIEVLQSFDDAPLYFWLHESIYGDGPSTRTNWAAHRAYLEKCSEASDFDYSVTCKVEDDRPVLFFGEMVFPWMTDDYAELRGVGLAAVAERLALRDDWSVLYNSDRMRAALATKVNAAAVVYYDDMYVDFAACMLVAKRGGPLERCKVWINNDYQHSGLRDDGAKIFTKLLGMAKGNIRTPS